MASRDEKPLQILLNWLESVSNEPAQATFDEVVVQDVQQPVDEADLITAPVDYLSLENPSWILFSSLILLPRTESPTISLLLLTWSLKTLSTFLQTIPWSSRSGAVYRLLLLSSQIDEGAPASCGLAVSTEPINCSQQSSMPSELDSESHPSLFSSDMASSSNAMPSRACGFRPSLSAVHTGNVRTSSATSTSLRGLFQSLWGRPTHQNARFVKLDERYIQNKKVSTASEARFDEPHACLDAIERERTELRATNGSLASESDDARQSVTTMTACVI